MNCLNNLLMEARAGPKARIGAHGAGVSGAGTSGNLTSLGKGVLS